MEWPSLTFALDCPGGGSKVPSGADVLGTPLKEEDLNIGRATTERWLPAIRALTLKKANTNEQDIGRHRHRHVGLGWLLVQDSQHTWSRLGDNVPTVITNILL